MGYSNRSIRYDKVKKGMAERFGMDVYRNEMVQILLVAPPFSLSK